MSDRRDDEAVIAEALRWIAGTAVMVPGALKHSRDGSVALASLSLRLQNAETALRFYADEDTWDDDGRAWHGAPSVPGMEQDEDRGRIARAALASSAKREPESETT